jgi:hypothetical protein
MTAAAHAVFATGPPRGPVATVLLGDGTRVRRVNGSGRAALTAVEPVVVASAVDCYRTHMTHGLVAATR